MTPKRRVVLLQADIDSGTVLNYATLDGWSPAPGSVRVTAREADLVALPRQERVSVVRMLESVTTSQGLNKDYSDQGDSATFKVTVSNTGNTKLRAVRVTDSMFDPEDLDCDHNFSSHTSGFMPASDQDGTVIVCRGTILLASSQVDEGGIHGTAKVSMCGFRVKRLWLCRIPAHVYPPSTQAVPQRVVDIQGAECCPFRP